MKKLENLIIWVLVGAGAVMLYQKLDSMGPESEPQSPPAAQTEAAAVETKPAAPETAAQPAPVATETPAPPAAATPAAPATAPPSAEPAAQPAAQPAASTTAMAEQPAAPAAAPAQPAPTPAAPATPEKPAAPVAEQPPPPAAPAQPAPPTPITVPPAPVAPAPVQVATATPPPAPAPAPAAPAEPQKKLAELTQDDLLARLPVNARMGYRTARSAAESRGDMIGLRSWFGQWRRYLEDPMRAVLELDMATLLLQSKASYPNESAAKAAKRGNANEARMLITGILFRRINNAELSEMVAKVRQDVDRELDQIK